jgi:hypothetical protein
VDLEEGMEGTGYGISGGDLGVVEDNDGTV